MAKTDLTEFLAMVKSKNVARSNRFRIDLNIPTGLLANSDFTLGKDYTETLKTISFFCYFAQFPPTNIQVNDIYTYGTPFWQPTIKLVDRLYIGIYLDQDFEIKKFFDAWINLIFDKDTSHLNFRDNYATTMNIFQLDQDMEPVYGVKLYDLFPTYIEPVSVHYSDKNKVSTLTAQLAYRKWEPLSIDLYRESDTDWGILGEIPGLLSKGFAAYSLYNQFKKLK